jgi:D-amino peptidase
MKIYISADIEGITGVTHPLQCNPVGDTLAYKDAVSMMAREVGWVCNAIWEQVEDAQIVVNDAHCRMTNLDVLQLPESHDVSLISGKPKSFAMVHGLDNSFDAALFIGYHAKAGSLNGVLAHTFHHHITDVSVNGYSLGEFGINSLYASLVHRVPVILGAGDQVLAEQIHQLSPDVAFIQTKVGKGFAVAECYSSVTVEDAYFDTIETLFANQEAWAAMYPTSPLLAKAPFVMEISFIDPLAADVVSTLPLLERLDGCTVKATAPDFETLYRILQSTYSLLGYADYQR